MGAVKCIRVKRQPQIHPAPENLRLDTIATSRGFPAELGCSVGEPREVAIETRNSRLLGVSRINFVPSIP